MGSGNNWAYGYNHHGPESKNTLINLLRKQFERNDSTQDVLLWQSLAGGTGSGLGSYLTKLIKEEFEDCIVMNLAVLPNIGGEVII